MNQQHKKLGENTTAIASNPAIAKGVDLSQAAELATPMGAVADAASQIGQMAESLGESALPYIQQTAREGFQRGLDRASANATNPYEAGNLLTPCTSFFTPFPLKEDGTAPQKLASVTPIQNQKRLGSSS